MTVLTQNPDPKSVNSNHDPNQDTHSTADMVCCHCFAHFPVLNVQFTWINNIFIEYWTDPPFRSSRKVEPTTSSSQTPKSSLARWSLSPFWWASFCWAQSTFRHRLVVFALTDRPCRTRSHRRARTRPTSSRWKHCRRKGRARRCETFRSKSTWMIRRYVGLVNLSLLTGQDQKRAWCSRKAM